MAKFVFKLKGLGADPDIIRTFTVGDTPTIRALAKARIGTETNDQVLLRLWTAFMNANVVDAEYLVRKNEALATAAIGITKLVPTIETTET